MERTLKRSWALLGTVTFISLLIVQILLGKAGTLISGAIPYLSIDPYDSFAAISIHHAVMLIIALALIAVLGKLPDLDFCFQLGDRKKGIRFVAVYAAAFAVISAAQHAFMALNGRLPVYAFPLDARNVAGTLGFQLLLSGPAEEVVFRALPVVLLTRSFGQSVRIKGSVTLEVILASLLFAFAHVSWSLSPLRFKADIFQVIYAFVLGTIQGIAYQRTRSILYPMLMHSISNVFMVGGGYLFAALLP
jgi:membrane protease YdiL (CAAX protease family)